MSEWLAKEKRLTKERQKVCNVSVALAGVICKTERKRCAAPRNRELAVHLQPEQLAKVKTP